MNVTQTEKKYILQTYKRQPLVFKRASGKYLWDERGKRYLDFFTGISVCNLGHSNPAVVSAAEKQLRLMTHVSNHYYIPVQVELAKLLIEKSFKKGKVFFSNSGAEANECAIKLARKRGNSIRKGKNEIIVFENSFHGRTLATLAATGQKKFHKGFEPLPPGFKYAKFNDIKSVERLAGRQTCAIMVEPVLGEGGIYPADKNFLKGLRILCNRFNALLIFDEIQCGMGRTGKLFAYQYYNVEPDIITMAKSIANGLPLGVTLVRKKYEKVMTYGDHGSTFGGNPVSCAAAISTIKLIDDKMLSHVTEMGNYFRGKLDCLQSDYPEIIKEVRQIGLMAGLELQEKSKLTGGDIVLECAKKGLIINCTQQKILRFLPPFSVNSRNIDPVLKTLREAIVALQGDWIP